jgi:hypothetical protein
MIRLAAQNQAGSPGVAAHAIVTAEGKGKAEPGNLTQQDVKATEHRQSVPVVELVPLRGEHAGLDLLILLDDGAGLDLTTQLNEIRSFINELPNTTTVSVGYMRNGTVDYTCKECTDHAKAAQSIRIPLGQPGISGSPYFSLSDAIKHWPDGAAERREVLMITDGIDRYGEGTGLDDPYVNGAISDAQKAGIVVFSIYTRGGGHFGHSYWRSTWGQNFLSQVSDETGGESYYIGPASPVSLKPYLDDMLLRFTRQYRITILAKAENKPELRPFHLQTEVPNTDLAYPDKIWVAAGM